MQYIMKIFKCDTNHKYHTNMNCILAYFNTRVESPGTRYRS